MLMHRPARGFTLLEVLITLIVLAIGLLGLASLQQKMQVAQVESYQRAQAVLLLQDMINRIDVNRVNAGDYVTAAPLGTGDTWHQDDVDAGGVEQHPGCLVDTNADGVVSTAERDLCEWSHAIVGASESLEGASTGAMIDGRGCITQEQAPDPTTGICTPGIYRVTVAWQGLNTTVAPALTCAQNQYGDDALRRVVSVRTVVELRGC